MSAPVDPLAGLRDVHLPTPVSWWPPAPGWWGVVILLLVMVLGTVIWFRYAKQRRYRKIALKSLAELAASWSGGDDARLVVAQIANLLRRVAIESYGRAAVAQLTGTAWLEFLDRTGKTNQFSQGAGEILGTAQYQPTLTADPAALCTVVKNWIKDHRPC